MTIRLQIVYLQEYSKLIRIDDALFIFMWQYFEKHLMIYSVFFAPQYFDTL